MEPVSLRADIERRDLPRNVERMAKCLEDLRPHNAEVSQISIRNLGEDTIENVSKQMTAEASHDCLATPSAARS